MAESSETVPDALESGGNDQDNAVKDFSAGTEFLWQTIYGFIKNLSEEDILQAMREFCCCVKTIIGAYEEKVFEIKALRNNNKELERKTKELQANNKNKEQIIKEQKSTISKLMEQLASSLCEECKAKNITSQFSSSLSLSPEEHQEDTSEPEPRENEEPESERIDQTDYGEVMDSQYLFSGADIRCPHAPCGFVALLCMLNKKGVYFCPTKLLLKLGAITRKNKSYFSCTKILSSLKDLYFITMIYKCEEINKGEHNGVLKIVGTELKNSGEEVGLLSYSTESYNHCVTVYLDESTTSDEPQLKICDAHLKRKDIKDLEEVCSLELIILRYDSNKDEPLIVKRWGDQCSSLLCEVELNSLSNLDHFQPQAVQDVNNSEL